MMNKRQIGTDKEQLAVHYMEKQGFRVKERNFRCKTGEIDIVGYDGEYLVFVEVKYRADYAKGGALAAVDIKKQRQICKIAEYYCYMHHLSVLTMIRYDVVGVQGDEVIWIKNAFMHIPRNM